MSRSIPFDHSLLIQWMDLIWRPGPNIFYAMGVISHILFCMIWSCLTFFRNFFFTPPSICSVQFIFSVRDPLVLLSNQCFFSVWYRVFTHTKRDRNRATHQSAPVNCIFPSSREYVDNNVIKAFCRLCSGLSSSFVIVSVRL